MNHKEIIDAIKAERAKQGISLRELEQRSGLSKSTINTFEMGVRNPRLDIVLKICDELGLKIEITK